MVDSTRFLLFQQAFRLATESGREQGCPVHFFATTKMLF